MRRAAILTLLLALSLHAADLFAGEMDLFTPEMQKLKREYKQETDKHAAARLQELNKLVQENLVEANALLAEKTASGNVSGMAIGKKAVGIFEKCAEDLKNTRDFAIPSRVRRELTDKIKVFEGKKKAIEEKYGVFLDPLRDRYYLLFVERVRAQSDQPMAEAQMKELFGMLIATEDRIPPKPGPGDGPPAGQGPGGETAGDTPPAMVVPEILGASGEADNWISFARLYAESHNLEMIRVPIMNIRDVRKGTGGGEMSGSPYKMLYRPLQVLQPAEGLVFRLKSIPRRLGVQVVEWPGPRNNWNLLLRVRPSGSLPAAFGAELQVNAGAPLGGTVGTEEEGEAVKGPKAAAKVKVPLSSVPEGATVFLDGEPYRPAGVSVKTPCVVVATEGKHEFKFMLLGYVNGVVSDFEVKPGAKVEWTFSKDMGMKEVMVKAYARTGWRSSRFSVAKGDRVSISTFGSWSCGTDREMVDGNGYSAREYAKYYSTPYGERRLTTRGSYGALLLRFGEKGPMGAVGKERLITAPADGDLYFGINEAGKWLGDNSGSLTIKIRKSGGG